MPLAILVLPADMAQKDKDSYQTLVYGLTQAKGMRFQVLNTLTADDLALVGPGLKVVIALPPDPGLAALTAAVNTAVADFTTLSQELTAAANEGDAGALQAAINNVNTLTSALSAAATAAVPPAPAAPVPPVTS